MYAGAASPIASPVATGSTPLSRSATQMTTPSSTNTERRWIRSRTAVTSTANAASAATSGRTLILSL